MITHERKPTGVAKSIESVPVREIFRGKTLWKGDVEVFDLSGHSKAKRCYGWSYGQPEQFITILKLPVVDSPESAVKVVWRIK